MHRTTWKRTRAAVHACLSVLSAVSIALTLRGLATAGQSLPPDPCAGNLCDDGNPCNGVEQCVPIPPGNFTITFPGYNCSPGLTPDPLPAGCGCCQVLLLGDTAPSDSLVSHALCNLTNASACFGQFFNASGCSDGGGCAFCGNGFVDPGEDCDPGADVPGDCCDAQCHFEVVGHGCLVDAANCTVDQCDGEGTCGTSFGSATSVFDPCNDDDPCTDDSCDPVEGCQHAPNTGALCDDGNACTQTDTCQSGTCTGTNSVVCTAADQCHVAGTCNSDTGACSSPTAANGTACSDGNACTQTDTCQSGACTGTNSVVCTAADQCHVAGTCNSDTGACSNPAAANGTTCSDGNACTHGDACDGGGQCVGTAISCVSDLCATRACNGTATCAVTPTNCDDGNICNGVETCAPDTGCHPGSPASVGTLCADGVFCNGSETCDGAGHCSPGTDPCAETPCNTCQEVAHSCFDPAGTMCNDNDAGTFSDACNGAGACKGHVVTGNYAVLGWPYAAPVLAKLGRDETIDGDVCANLVWVSQHDIITGDVVATAGTGLAMSGFFMGTQLSQDLVSGGGTIRRLGLDLATHFTGRVEEWNGQPPIPMELVYCQAAATHAESQHTAFMGSSGMSVGDIHVRVHGTGTLQVGDGVVTLDATRLTVIGFGTLTLAGSAATDQVIVRISGKLTMGHSAQIVLQNLMPEQVLFMVNGRTVIGAHSTVPGTIFGNDKVLIGRDGLVDGQVLSSKPITIGQGEHVTGRPFKGW